MIDKNNKCARKSKLKITVKTFSKFNCPEQCSNQTNKQSQSRKNWQTFRQKNISKEQNDILTNRDTSIVSTEINK